MKNKKANYNILVCADKGVDVYDVTDSILSIDIDTKTFADPYCRVGYNNIRHGNEEYNSVRIDTITLDVKSTNAKKVVLSNKIMEQIALYNSGIENQLLTKKNEVLELEIKKKESKLNKLKETEKLLIEYLKSDYGDFDKFIRNKYYEEN